MGAQGVFRTVLGHLERGDWKAAHEIVQEWSAAQDPARRGEDEESALSCWAHGIVHIMEGDLPNARYWYGEAKRPFPADPSAAAEIAAFRSALEPGRRSGAEAR